MREEQPAAVKACWKHNEGARIAAGAHPTRSLARAALHGVPAKLACALLLLSAACANKETRETVSMQTAAADTQTIEIAGQRLNRAAYERCTPEDVQVLASVVFGTEPSAQDEAAAARLRELSPSLDPTVLRCKRCLTPALGVLRGIIVSKAWPETTEQKLRALSVVTSPPPDASHNCGNFMIEYWTTGVNAVPPTDTASDIVLPGTQTVLDTMSASDGVPDYIELLCFWLQRALSAYKGERFGLQDPADFGTIRVLVKKVYGSSYDPDADILIIDNDLNAALLAFTASHELMHVVQRRCYDGPNPEADWGTAVREGGAILAEDALFDNANRYMVEATNDGSIARSWEPLNGGQAYDACLLMKYLCEQQSNCVGPANEPMIGVEAYSAVLKECGAHGYTSETIAHSVADLPWYQTFSRFKYLDEAELDETSSETLLGDYWLALYLKDLGRANPDRRFDFMENGEDASFDELAGGPPVATLGNVTLLQDVTLAPGVSLPPLVSGQDPIDPFAAAFYRVAIDESIDTLRVAFDAKDGFERPLVQIVLVEPSNVVRDILRSDRMHWDRSIANKRAGVPLDHILIVVASTDTGGKFTLDVTESTPSPDLMVTRWHHVAGTHYEIDPSQWAWTWVSPDIWVDNDGDGLADDVVVLGQDNQLVIRLRNQGHADASEVDVSFWYQDAAAGLSDSAWQRVEDAGGMVQSLAGLSLAAGATGTFGVKWAPQPSGDSKHFCVRAVVSCPRDPNPENNRCLSNFGNVVPNSMGSFDVSLIRRELDKGPPDQHCQVIPRAFHRWIVSGVDLAHASGRLPPREDTDRFHFERYYGTWPDAREDVPRRVERAPDLLGDYPTDPRALPPGVPGAPMITIVQIRGGEVVGGFTWAIREH